MGTRTREERNSKTQNNSRIHSFKNFTYTAAVATTDSWPIEIVESVDTLRAGTSIFLDKLGRFVYLVRLREILKNLPVDGQTWQAKSSLPPVRLCGVHPLIKPLTNAIYSNSHCWLVLSFLASKSMAFLQRNQVHDYDTRNASSFLVPKRRTKIFTGI